MTYIPSLEDVLEEAKRGESNLIPVFRDVPADLETPVSAFLKVARGEHSFLLESVEGGERIGRYTYVGRDPFLTVKAWGTRIELDEGGEKSEREGNIFELMRELTQRYEPAGQEGLPPLSAGAVGYIGYDLVRQIEPRVPEFRERDVDAPDAIFMFFSSLVVFDHVKHEVYLVANVRTEEYEDIDDGFHAAQRVIDRFMSDPKLAPKLASFAAERFWSRGRFGEAGTIVLSHTTVLTEAATSALGWVAL
ncbi:MAG: hypothetical protein IIC86_03115, partial [Chloroflexi bacterium]|nr:hypothetical protein [Chloroflexota bacterium]